MCWDSTHLEGQLAGDPQWAIPTVVKMEVWRGLRFYVIIIFARSSHTQ